jgi:primosomal protein N' (replication factor Y) (superfamily II helicase)
MPFICQVILDIPNTETAWNYLSDTHIKRGCLVEVPVLKRKCLGIVTQCSEINADITSITENNKNIKLKKITCISAIFMPEKWLNMMQFMATYYHEQIGEIALQAMPAYIKHSKYWQNNLLESAYQKYVTQFNQHFEKTKNKLNNIHNINHVELNHEQQHVLNNILHCTQMHAIHLLHGITGSGKTEVYLHLIRAYLNQNNQTQILILIPEINLTPQIVSIIQKRFTDVPIAILHSHLSEKQRAIYWYAAYTGFARIIIGTRLASMCIMPHLALIIVDEEHDLSYKQQSGIRYHARNILIWRAKQLNIPIVLGSATPSLESYNAAQINKYSYHTLKTRATQAKLPRVNIIDNALYLKKQMAGHMISPPLEKAMRETLNKGKQVLLFLNRRGFAPVMFCSNCNYIFDCKHCSVNMVFHQTTSKLHCHHCGYQQILATQCPKCEHTEILPVGYGTQRLDATLLQLFPEYRHIRIDSDSTSKKGDLEVKLAKINAQEVDIIIGTQMLSKGHDFKHVEMLGIIQPDGMLYSYNYRSTEHLFAQLMQVIGRAGRHGEGQVWIQTAFPNHLLYDALKKHDYDVYAKKLLEERKQAQLTPFSFEAHIYASHTTPQKAITELQNIHACIQQQAQKINCLITPATPHNILKHKDEERAYIVIEHVSRQILHTFLNTILPLLKKLNSAWYIEIIE